MTRSGLLWLGLALLAVALFLQAGLAYLQDGLTPGDGFRLFQLVSALGSPALFVGAGLTVAGAVLKVLEREARGDLADDDEPGVPEDADLLD